MMTGAAPAGPIGEVREGMRVQDAAGEDIGTVSLIQLSDPGVTTSEGQSASDEATEMAPAVPATPGGGIGAGGGVGTPAGIFAVGAAGATEPDVPAPLAERLVRTGYLKIGKGIFHRDVYVGADRIDRVTDEVVILASAKDELVKES